MELEEQRTKTLQSVVMSHGASMLNGFLGAKINIDNMVKGIWNGAKNGKVPEDLTAARVEFLEKNYGDKAAALIEVVKEHG